MIVGTVVDDDGRAVARAIVRFAKLAEYSRDNQGKARLADVGFQGSVNTNEDGTFRILGLPSGRYKVCAYDSGSKGLTGCAWELLQSLRLDLARL
jgi:protocatechuate 3,4-dioxygenase beta subunit